MQFILSLLRGGGVCISLIGKKPDFVFNSELGFPKKMDEIFANLILTEKCLANPKASGARGWNPVGGVSAKPPTKKGI